MHEPVEHPQHYQIKPFWCSEVLDIIEAFELDFITGNIIKYVLRYAQKNGEEDLRKALWYLERKLGEHRQTTFTPVDMPYEPLIGTIGTLP